MLEYEDLDTPLPGMAVPCAQFCPGACGWVPLEPSDPCNVLTLPMFGQRA